LAIIGSDSFSRADQSGWGNASDGQTWSQVQGAGTLAIASNEGTFTGQIATDEVMVLGSTSQADTDCLVRFKVTNSGNDVPGVVFRSNGSNTFYRVRNNSGTLGIRRINAGSSTTVGVDTAVAMSAGTFYWIRGKIVGSTIYATMWADGGSEPAPQITVTDGTPISTAGRFGIYASINTTATDTIFYDHFTATDTVVAAPSTYPRFIPRALGATIIPVIVSQPLPYIDRALGSTIIYEDRTFIPRALGGVYIPDTVMWVPRGLSSIVQSSLLRSLTLAGVGTLSPTLSANLALPATTLAGVGTLTGTLSLSAALTAECDGVGTLAGTLSANTALSAQLAGVATCSALSLQTQASQPLPYIGRGLLSTIVYEARVFIPRALSATYIPDTSIWVPRALDSGAMQVQPLAATLPGVGTLAGTLSTTGGVSLSVTMAGVGTLAGTLPLSTALSTTMSGVGTLTGTLSASLTLPSTSLVGVGTLAGTLVLTTALSRTLTGVGTLTGVFSPRTALFLTCAGVGTLAGNLSIPSTSYLTAVWVTRDLVATWVTRDGKVTWATRDEKAAWAARDEQDTWATRDEQALWKTRS